MEKNTAAVEAVTLSDILELATWQRQRSTEELKNFISRHEATLSAFDEESV